MLRVFCVITRGAVDRFENIVIDYSIIEYIIVVHTRSVRKVSDRIFLCEHLMDYNLAHLHEPTLNLSAHA